MTQTLKIGEIIMRSGKGTSDLFKFRNLELEYYLPKNLSSPTNILVSVHGISRNAAQHIALFRGYADATGTLIIAPKFSRKKFRDYQTLGLKRSIERADSALIAAITELLSELEIPFRPFNLVGYSGGAQFCHRFAMLYPEYVKELHLGAAGWYTFPDEDKAFPYGIRASKDANIVPKMESFYSIKKYVYVGALDTGRDRSLNTSELIDRQQGFHRLARARRWVDAIQFEATKLGLCSNISLMIIPNAHHTAEAIFSSPLFYNNL